ncbi:SusC/RagA family TonB-linked outer membrane protein, partial [Zunongwangia profunda]
PLKLESSLFQTQITGTVKSSADQLPMPGVSVVEKGTSNGAVTDFDGNFKLNVSSNDAVLVFSFIGFKTMERRLEGKTSIEIFMEEDQAQLDEVVLVGYSEQRREVITGAVATVSSEELAKSPTLNVSNALTGRMPGVVATQNSGEPGYDGSTISIRGSNSFGDNSPLVVIDGIPDRQGGFSRLNPADIKDISVLKDASAAIYGARAANGVILVTTKRGKVGKTSLSYDYNLGFSKPTVIPDLANASQYAMMRNELEIYKFPVSEWSPANAGFMSDGVYTRPSGGEVTAPFSPEDIRQFQDGSDPWFHPDTDWFSETLKDWSTQSRHTLQITGGTEDLKILSTIGYQNQDAYYKKSATNYKQYDIRLNMDAKINDYITAKIGVLGRQEDRNYPTKPASSIFRMLMRSSPTQPAYWPNGMPGPDIEYGENPVVITTDQTGYDRDRRYYFQSNGQLDIEIPWVKGLKFTGTAAVDKYIQQT